MNKKAMLMQREIYSLQKKYLNQANIFAGEYKMFIAILNNRHEPFFESELKTIMDAKKQSMIDYMDRVEENKKVIEAIELRMKELDLELKRNEINNSLNSKKKSKRKTKKEINKLVKEYIV